MFCDAFAAHLTRHSAQAGLAEWAVDINQATHRRWKAPRLSSSAVLPALLWPGEALALLPAQSTLPLAIEGSDHLANVQV